MRAESCQCDFSQSNVTYIPFHLLHNHTADARLMLSNVNEKMLYFTVFFIQFYITIAKEKKTYTLVRQISMSGFNFMFSPVTSKVY